MGAIEVINISSGNNANWTHIVPASLTNSALVVLVGTHQGNVTGITYGGVALTKINSGRSSFNEDGDIWILLSPNAGSATVAISTDGGSWWGGSGVTLNNVEQTTTVTSAINNGSSGTASVTITPDTGNCLLLTAVGTEATPSLSTPTSAQRVNILQGQSFENFGGMFWFTKTGSPVSAAFSLSSGQRWGMAVACINEVSAPLNIITQRRLNVGNGVSVNESAK